MTKHLTDEPAPDGDALLDEQLSAYLDGELDSPTIRAVEERLARDEQARSHLHSLEQAWSLLDQLPRSELTEAFTHSTVEMIAVERSAEHQAARSWLSPRRTLGWLAAAAGVLFAATLGFNMSRRIVGRNDERLLRDLPVIEQLDAYRQIDDVELLRALRRADLFTKEESPRGT